MATIYPTRPSPQSNAEDSLYYWFKNRLSNDYTVFHNIRLTNQPKPGLYIERECDFIIIHPNYGCLVLEVKGGTIVHNGKQGNWLINGKDAESPIKQAKDEKYALRNFLKTHPHTAEFAGKLRYEHAVWFFRCEKQPWVFPDIDSTCVLFQEDYLSGEPNFIFSRIFQRLGAARYQLTLTQLDLLTNAIVPSITSKSDATKLMKQDDKAMYELTMEQLGIFWRMHSERQLLIAGAAGTGKTILAYESAWRLAKEGERVLLLCNSAYTAKKLQSIYQGSSNTRPKFDIFHPRELISQFVQRSNNLLAGQQLGKLVMNLSKNRD